MEGKYAKEKTKTNSIIKKIILMAVVVTMLAGDFIFPIKLWSIAKELEKNISASQSKDVSNENMEDNNEFQDLILSVHHACMDFFNKNENAIKLLANNQRKFFMQ